MRAEEEAQTLDLRHTSYRNINQDVVEKYGVLTGFDGDREVCRLYPYAGTRPKKRILPKDFSENKGFSATSFFGQELFNKGSSKALVVTEGEDDALAAYQMLGAKSNWPVVAIPGANMVNNPKFIKAVYDYVCSFESIVLAFDNDEAGDKAADKFAATFPRTCYRLSMSKHKDACDYLVNGDAKDFMYSFINRQKYVAEFDTNTPEQFLRVLEESKDAEYIPTGIQAFDDVALGLMQGHFTVFTAPEGVGKTELMRMLEFNLVDQHPDVPFAFWHAEEKRARSILGLASYRLQKNVTRMGLIDDMDEVRKAIADIASKENMHQFSLGVDDDPETIVERAKYYAKVCNCKYFFFEPIQDLAHQRLVGSETAEQLLSRISVQLSRVAAETGMGIVTIAHQNDQGEIRDCRLIGKQASVRVDLHRDTMSTDEELRNTTDLKVVKNRPASTTGFAGQLKFDPETFTLREKVY